jgi:hypothetical protein
MLWRRVKAWLPGVGGREVRRRNRAGAFHAGKAMQAPNPAWTRFRVLQLEEVAIAVLA